MLGTVYGIASGVVVDTHVGRLSRRLALTVHEDPVDVEQDLMKLVPVEKWTEFSHLLIFHGRQICFARNPQCDKCTLLPDCPTGQALTKAVAAATGKKVGATKAKAKRGK